MAQLKATVPFVVACLVIFSSSSALEAREFLVGGTENAWKIPPSPMALNQWAGRNRFRVGDVLSSSPTTHDLHATIYFAKKEFYDKTYTRSSVINFDLKYHDF